MVGVSSTLYLPGVPNREWTVQERTTCTEKCSAFGVAFSGSNLVLPLRRPHLLHVVAVWLFTKSIISGLIGADKCPLL
jgi:hypothetical protein